MTKMVAGVAIAFLLGAICRWLKLPVPAPPTVFGALLVMAVTLGFIVTDKLLGR